MINKSHRSFFFLLTFSALTLQILNINFAAAQNKNIEVLFSHPTPQQDDFSIQERVGSLIDQAVPGSRVRINIYLFNYTLIAQKIVEALNRGVDIKIVLDRKSGNDQVYDILSRGYKKLKGLDDPKLCPDKDCITVCSKLFFSGACIGSRNNHNKFYLFEQLSDGRQDVSVQSSSNLTEGVSWNDLVEVSNHRALFETYLGYWNQSQKRVEDKSYSTFFKGDNFEVYFSPQKKKDFYLEILNRTDCSQGGSIYLAHSRFTDDRLKVAKKLKSLQKQGCSIQALVTSNPGKGSPGSKISKELKNEMIVTTTNPTALHTKMMTIDAFFDEKKQKVVLTGSHNLNKNSRKRNDDVLLVIKDDSAHDRYTKYWKLMEGSLIKK